MHRLLLLLCSIYRMLLCGKSHHKPDFNRTPERGICYLAVNRFEQLLPLLAP